MDLGPCESASFPDTATCRLSPGDPHLDDQVEGRDAEVAAGPDPAPMAEVVLVHEVAAIDGGEDRPEEGLDVHLVADQPAGGGDPLPRSSRRRRLRACGTLRRWRTRSGSIRALLPRDSWMSASMTASQRAVRYCSPSIFVRWRSTDVARP